jgi:hypothetical protein
MIMPSEARTTGPRRLKALSSTSRTKATRLHYGKIHLETATGESQTRKRARNLPHGTCKQTSVFSSLDLNAEVNAIVL